MSKVKNNIKALDFPESIRVRSVMYMGDSNNSDHALTEVLDNASDHVFRDESVSKIEVKTCDGTPKDYFYVANDGSPFPISLDPVRKVTKSELAASHMHAGSNFEGGNTSIGQNGVGIKCTNALSEFFYIITLIKDDSHLESCEEVKSKGSNGLYYFLKYERGIKKLESVGTLDEICSLDNIQLPKGYVTYVVSKPDYIIYTENTSARVDNSRVADAILIFKNFYNRKIKYIIDGVEVKISNVGYKYKTLKSIPIPGLKYRDTIELDGEIQDDKSSPIVPDRDNLVELKFLFDFEFSSDLDSSISNGNINTRRVSKGIHVNKVRELIGQALKEVFSIPHDYTTKGISLNSLILAPGSHLQLAGQTKDSLIRIKCFTDSDWKSLYKAIVKTIKSNREEIQLHVARLNEYAISLDKLAAKDYVKSMVSITKNNKSTVSKRVRDASNMDRSKCSLFIVEGQSAASSLLEARDPDIHAIFPMRGFSLNTVGRSLEDVFKNEEYKDLITAIGAGVDAFNDINCARYGKIIICADADPDGFAITSLICAMFGDHLSFLIEDGRVFINESPLYFQDGNYYRSYEKDKLNLKKEYTRFKGLGELDDYQAEDVFFGKAQKLIKLTMKDLDKALELMSSTDAKKELMGKNNIVKYK